ncbi:hypothetical protein GOODEAATRI_031174 [Goodea atripinnis]|uniref:Uncharacterized protein n=1 Tax=Goodea atripinnis TaxID=208336 RepID=A0ABV0NPT1_9TELE
MRRTTGWPRSDSGKPSGTSGGGSSVNLSFRRSSAVFVPAVVHWTSSTPSAEYSRVHWSLPNQSTCFVDLESYECLIQRYLSWCPVGGAPGVWSWGPFIRGHPVSVQAEQEFGPYCRY